MVTVDPHIVLVFKESKTAAGGRGQ